MDAEKSFQERIRERYEKLTPGFRRLADFLSEETLDAAFLTATELSRRVQVDPATVVRFAQELGYSGYRELSRKVKAYVRAQIKGSYRHVEEAEGEEARLAALVEYKSEQLRRFWASSKSDVVRAVEMLMAAQRLWVVAEGADSYVAAFAASRFEALGFEGRTIVPTMTDAAEALLGMQEGDLLLAIVSEEPALDTAAVVELAGKQGVRTICISSKNVAKAAREAEVVLHVPSKSAIAPFDFSTVMAVLSLLWEMVAQARGEVVAQRQEARQEMLERLFQSRLETEAYEIVSVRKVWEERLNEQEG